MKSDNLFPGEFLIPYESIVSKIKTIKAFIFDWDGVFNDGEKAENTSAPFREADAMGVNLIRFAYWLNNNEIPLTTIISGEDNPSAIFFAKREHLHQVYSSFKNKVNALDHINQTFGISPQNIAYVFDDVLDIPIAKQAGLRFMIGRDASPAFTNYAKKNNICDYITKSQSSNFAVREVCELILSAFGLYDEVINQRIEQGFNYREYINNRDSIKTAFFSLKNGSIVKSER